MANSNNPYASLAPHQDLSPFNNIFLQQPITNPEDITDPITAMNMALALMAKAFKLNYSTPTNNNQRISSNPRNRQIAQLGMNMGQDRQMQMIGGNGGNQFRQYAGQNAGNLNGYNEVQNVENQNQIGNGNLVAIRAEGNATGQNATGQNANQISQNGVDMLLLFIRPRICTQLITLNSPHQDQSSFNQNYLQQPISNPEDITDPTTAMNMALALMAKAFKLNYSTPTSSNPMNKQIAQSGQNARNSAGYNDVIGNQVMQNAVQNPRVQNIGNQNGLIGVQGNGNQNHIGNGNLVAAHAEGNAAGQNGNQIRCYNCRGVEEYDLMAAAAVLDEIEEVNANCILMANLQQASTLGTQTDSAPVYDTDGLAEVHENCDDNEIFNMFTQEERYTELLEPIPESHQVPQYDNDVISEDTSMEQVQNVRNQVAQNAIQNPRIQNVGTQNGQMVVLGSNQNPNRNGNLVAVCVEGNATGHNGNQIRCYNCRGVGHFARNCTVRPRRRDAAYLQTQLLIAQKEEAGIQLQAKEFDLMAAATDFDEIKEVNANCILMENLQQALTSGTQTDKAPVYDSDGSAEVAQNPRVQNVGIQNQIGNEEYDLMAPEADLDEIEEVNANCILMANLQQASSSGTQTDSTPFYNTDGSAEVHENYDNNEIFNMFTQEEQYTEPLEPIPEPQQVPQNDNNVISK
nr:hypothetical protein [Tanacetum cinerariifolium]